MRKECPPPSPKLFHCFETTTTPLVATFVALTLVLLLWNQNLLFTTTPSSSSSCSSLSTPNSTFITSSSAAKKYSTQTQTQTPPSLSDPNKRTFQSFGNAASLFVLMGAYRGGPLTFSIVGLSSKPLHVYGNPWYKCDWISSNGSSIRSKAYKILPDWGYGRVYTVVVVNCTFPFNPNYDNSGGKLTLNAYYSKSLNKYEKFTALQESPGSYNPSKFNPPFQYDYLYCGSSLYGNISASRIREWIAYHAWFFGPKSHFVFHDAGGVSQEVSAVLHPWVRAGRVTIQDIRGQQEYDGYYYNQFLVVNDCLHRYRHAANWTFYFDVDEYIYIPEGEGEANSLDSVMQDLSEYTQFTIEQNPMSSSLCLNDSTLNYSRKWGFEKLLFKDTKTGIWRDRKYAIQAKNAYATGVHMSENVIGKTTHKTESKIRYYHYHNSIMVMGELCREFLPISAIHNVTIFNNTPFVYDDKMTKLASTIKEFELKTIGNANAKLFS